VTAKVQKTFLLTPELAARIETEAARDHRSVSAYGAMLLERSLTEEKERMCPRCNAYIPATSLHACGDVFTRSTGAT
jgi:hypothetical protein